MPRRDRLAPAQAPRKATMLRGHLKLQPRLGGKPWCAEITTDDGRTWRFDDLPSLVLFMVRVSIDPQAQAGLR